MKFLITLTKLDDSFSGRFKSTKAELKISNFIHESKKIQYFCNYCLALVNSRKFLSCIALVSQCEKYY